EGKYKELLETYQTDLAQMKAKEAERERHAEIVAKLKGHGFNDKDADKHATRIGKYVSDDDDLESEIKDYASDFKAASTVDPSAGYGDKGSHKPKDDEDYGQDVLDRVKGLSRTKFGKQNTQAVKILNNRRNMKCHTHLNLAEQNSAVERTF